MDDAALIDIQRRESILSLHRAREVELKIDNIIDKNITCVEFAPDIFEHIRWMDNLGVDDLRASMDPEIEENAKRIFSAGESMGKSGSFFFFSHDQRFLIKTMFTEEFEIFMHMFKYYFEHLNNYPDSLMARIYGIYSIQMEGMSKVYLILMAFTKKCDDRYVKRTFDLKGSMINREEKGEMRFFKNTKTLKDVNFLTMQREERCLLFQDEDIDMINK
jgi:1-phosphatidylinositol-4-phosphate 5-kinase